MRKILFLPVLLFALAACSPESEHHQTTVLRPNTLVQYVDGEGGQDSLVFLTTESFTLTSSVNSESAADGEWCTFPDAFRNYDSQGSNIIVEFHVPLFFTRNATKRQRTVTFNIGAGKYSVSAMFIQDTIHAEPISPAVPENNDTPGI